MDDVLQRLGRRIRDLRSERGWSQEQFADVCGVHRTYMGHLERGEKNVSFGTLLKVANALGVSLSNLFKGIEDGKPASRIGRQNSPELDRPRILQEMAILERSMSNLRSILDVKRPERPGRRRS